MSQIRILCEGRDDQAFWGGWLRYLGAGDLWREAKQDETRLPGILNRAGITSAPDRDSRYFRAHGPESKIIVVQQCREQRELWRNAEVVIKEARIEHLVINCDSDLDATDPQPAAPRLQRLRETFDVAGDPPFLLGAIGVNLVVWHCEDRPSLPGVPDKQTLERLVCAAIAAAKPTEWKNAVDEFLRREPVLPEGQGPTHKNYSRSYFAKFFAHEFIDVFDAAWKDKDIALQLEARLRQNGNWDRITSLVGGS